MIPANELRIGNWVYTQSTKLIKEQSPTTPFRIKVVTKQEEHKWHPIPLDADILGKCGLKIDKNFTALTYYDGEKITIKVWKSGKYNGQIQQVYINGCDIKVEYAKYLHQLQNLYFALTGQELEIQL